nr:hypothetical protein [Porticoccaceae bacterium]
MASTNSLKTAMLYSCFKYTVYALLAFNIVLFFQEEMLATAQTFSQGIRAADIIQGFAATIDTAAWVLLLLLFELETSLLTANTLGKTRIRVSFILVRIFSYGFIGYAFYGYLIKMLLINGIAQFYDGDAC